MRNNISRINKRADEMTKILMTKLNEAKTVNLQKYQVQQAVQGL